MKNGKYNVINGWSNLLGTWWVLFSTKKLNENMGSAIKVRNLVLWKLVIKNFSESEKVFIEDLALELRSIMDETLSSFLEILLCPSKA